MNIRTLINSVPATSIDVNDRGLHYGDGLFETMAVIHGAIRRLDLHLDRLAYGCARLGIPCPPRALLTNEFSSLAQSAERAILKLILTRGPGMRGYALRDVANPTRILTLHDWPDYPSVWSERGVAVHTCTTTLAQQPLLAGIKHLNRLEHILARREWTDDGIAEGLLYDTDGNLVGGTKTNVFLVTGTTLTTPLLTHCGVAGTTRATVLTLARGIGLRPTEAHLTQDDLTTADEIFLTNAVIGIWPVRELATRRMPAGPVTRRLQELLR